METSKVGAPLMEVDAGRSDGVANALLGAWLALTGLVVFVTTIFGVVHYFSPIPFSDQWIGYVGFVHTLDDGNRSIWWAQHMEHRIVFSRLLFWLDANLFGGRNVFLFIAAIILQALTATLFVVSASRGRRVGSLVAIAGIVLAFLFSWVQSENFTWAFQSQFFAVYLFALSALAAFSFGAGNDRSRFAGLSCALLFAILATLSMGNGLAVFAVMCFQSLLLRRPRKELIVPIVAGALVSALYFTGYQKPDIGLPHVAPADMIRLAPHFFLSFMGSATYFLKQSFTTSALFGLASLIAMAYMTVRLYLERSITPYRSFLIAGYAFVVITALAATSGRYAMGMPQAVVSRYATPMFVSWVCLFLLAIDSARNNGLRRSVLICSAVAATWTATYQKNVDNDTSELFQRDLAVLSMKIGIDRPDLVQSIFFPRLRPYLLGEAQYAADTNFGPYASGWLHDAGLVKFDPAKVVPGCQGSLDRIDSAPTSLTISGWAQTPHKRDELIVLTDASGATIGYGVTGQARPDVERAMLGAGANTGWIGFAKRTTGPVSAYAYTRGAFCKLGQGITRQESP